MKVSALITTFVLLLCAACTDPAYNRRLDRAEQLIMRYDSAALPLLDSLNAEAPQRTKADRMRNALIQAQARNAFYMSMAADSSLRDVAAYYRSHGNSRERMMAYYMVGCYYRDKADAPRALESFQTAVEQADTTQADCDYYILCRIYAQTAVLFHQQRTPQLELPAWQKAVRYAWRAKDTLSAINYISLISTTYHLMGKESDALRFVKTAYKLHTEYGRTDLAAVNSASMIYYEVEQGDFTNARKHVTEFKEKSGIIDKNYHVLPGYEDLYLSLGKYYDGIAQYDSALYFYRKLLLQPTIEHMESSYRGQLSVYQQKHIPDSIVKYARLLTAANDSANLVHSATEITRTQALYNYNISNKIAAEKAAENHRLWITVVVILVAVVGTTIVAFFYWRRAKKRNLRKVMAFNKRYSDTLYKYGKLAMELSELKSNHDAYRQKMEQEVVRLETALNSGEYEVSLSGVNDTEKILMAHPAVIKMHKLAQHIQLPLNADWNDLFQLVETHLPHFYSVITSSAQTLTESEQRAALLMRLYFIPSEMATLLDITKQRVTNIRSSINKKLFDGSGTKGVDQNILEL